MSVADPARGLTNETIVAAAAIVVHTYQLVFRLQPVHLLQSAATNEEL